MEYTLQMTFICENGEKSTMSITGIKSEISKGEIFDLMDSIIENDVFITKNGALTAKYSAQVTEKQVTKHVA